MEICIKRVLTLVVCCLATYQLSWAAGDIDERVIAWEPDWHTKVTLKVAKEDPIKAGSETEEIITVRAMQDSDIDSMKHEFVEAFDNQYKKWTLADLGKGKPYTSIREWLEVVAKGEADEYSKRKGDSNRRDIVAINEDGDLIAYTAIEIIYGGRNAYLAQGFIAPSYQRLGAESCFMQSILAQVLPESITILTLLVRLPHNKMAAKAHEAVGFKRLSDDASDRYATSLDYPIQYYKSMAKSTKEGIDAETELMKLMDEAAATAVDSKA